MRSSCAVALVVLCAAAAPVVYAQEMPAPVAPVRETPSASGTRWQFDQCMGGVTYGAPLKWALSYGMGWVRESITGGVLRTFNDPMGALARRTYVGGSVHLWPLLALGGELGYYTRVGTDPAGTTRRRGLITWSTGFGF